MELPELPAGWVVVVDSESKGAFVDEGARVSTISMAWIDPADGHSRRSAAIPLSQGPSDDTQAGLWSLQVTAANGSWLAVLDWLRDKRLVFHNAIHDIPIIAAGTVDEPGEWLDLHWDTMVAAKELWPNTLVGLDAIGKRMLNVGKDSEALKSYLKRNKLPAGAYDQIPWVIMEPYAVRDALLTLEIYLLQRQWVAEGGLQLASLLREFEMTKILIAIERRGVPYPAAESRRVGQLVAGARKGLADRLPFAPTITGAKQFWFGTGRTAKGIPCRDLEPYDVTPTGKPQLTDDVTTRMVKNGVEHADIWASYQKLHTAQSMWYDGYADKTGPDGRIRTRYRQTKVISGRYSVERVNLQAIPHDYQLQVLREQVPGIITPRELIEQAVASLDDYEVWELDWAQAELRMAALEAGCTPMLDAFVSGADLHGDTSTALFGVQPDDPSFKKLRQVGKRANFSCCFGVGWVTFRDMVRVQTGIELSPKDSERIVDDWNQLYPEFGRAINKWSRIAERDRRITLRGGRQRWLAEGEFTHKMFNQRVQGSLAELGKDAMIWIEAHFPGAMVLTVHDSFWLQFKRGEGAAAVARIQAWATDYGTRFSGVGMNLDAKLIGGDTDA